MRDYLKHERGIRDYHAHHYNDAFTEYELVFDSKFILSELNHVPKGSLIDIGCGTGRLTESLAEYALRYIGLDFSHESLKILQKNSKPGIRLVEADALQVPFHDNSFDTVISSQLFEQFLNSFDAIKFLREVKRICRPAGTIIITTFNYSWPCRFTGSRKRIENSLRANFIRYTRTELHRLLLNVFKAEEIRSIKGIINFKHRPLGIFGRIFGATKFHYISDKFISRTPLSAFMGHILISKIVKSD